MVNNDILRARKFTSDVRLMNAVEEASPIWVIILNTFVFADTWSFDEKSIKNL